MANGKKKTINIHRISHVNIWDNNIHKLGMQCVAMNDKLHRIVNSFLEAS